MTAISSQLPVSYCQVAHWTCRGGPELQDSSLRERGGTGGEVIPNIPHDTSAARSKALRPQDGRARDKLLSVSSWEPSWLVWCHLRVCRHSPGSGPAGTGLLPSPLPRPGAAAQSGGWNPYGAVRSTGHSEPTDTRRSSSPRRAR